MAKKVKRGECTCDCENCKAGNHKYPVMHTGKIGAGGVGGTTQHMHEAFCNVDPR